MARSYHPLLSPATKSYILKKPSTSFLDFIGDYVACEGRKVRKRFFTIKMVYQNVYVDMERTKQSTDTNGGEEACKLVYKERKK